MEELIDLLHRLKNNEINREITKSELKELLDIARNEIGKENEFFWGLRRELEIGIRLNSNRLKEKNMSFSQTNEEIYNTPRHSMSSSLSSSSRKSKEPSAKTIAKSRKKYEQRKNRQERYEKEQEQPEREKNIGVILLNTAKCLIQSDATIQRYIPDNSRYFGKKPLSTELQKYFNVLEMREINSNYRIQHYLELLYRFLIPMKNINKQNFEKLAHHRLVDHLIVTKDNLESLRYDHTRSVRQRDLQDSYLNEIGRMLRGFDKYSNSDIFLISPMDFNFQSGIQNFAGQDMPYLNWRDNVASVIAQRLNCGIYFLQNI
jgi:hypothetical protein